MAKYMTKQRAALLDFLQAHPDQAMSAGQISAAMDGEQVSASAVYRNLAELETEGRVRRLRRGDGREVFFQYLDGEDCRNSVHLSCTRCGRTFHMNALGAERMLRDVERSDSFQVDRSETVLYGLCGSCRRETEGET